MENCELFKGEKWEKRMLGWKNSSLSLLKSYFFVFFERVSL
jgi:hypothetical protein